MDLSPLIPAGPLVPIIRVIAGPRLEDIFEVDRTRVEQMRDWIAGECTRIPNINEGIGWELIRPYVNGNGGHARLLVALGDEQLGFWKMHPRPEHAEMWRPQHPMVLAGSVTLTEPSRRHVPKPSAGELDIRTVECGVCGRQRADASAFELDPKFEQCDYCGESREKESEKEKRAHASMPPPREAEDEEMPQALAAYIKGLAEGSD